MPLSEDTNNAAYQIQSCTAEYIIVNGKTYRRSVIITTTQIITDWPPLGPDTITENDLNFFLTLEPEIILIGTGKISKILPKRQLALLINRQYHVECMNTPAACRTYMALASEGRQVAAGLIL